MRVIRIRNKKTKEEHLLEAKQKLVNGLYMMFPQLFLIFLLIIGIITLNKDLMVIPLVITVSGFPLILAFGGYGDIELAIFELRGKVEYADTEDEAMKMVSKEESNKRILKKGECNA